MLSNRRRPVNFLFVKHFSTSDVFSEAKWFSAIFPSYTRRGQLIKMRKEKFLWEHHRVFRVKKINRATCYRRFYYFIKCSKTHNANQVFFYNSFVCRSCKVTTIQLKLSNNFWIQQLSQIKFVSYRIRHIRGPCACVWKFTAVVITV